MGRGPPLQHLPKLSSGLGQELTVPLVDDHSVVADGVEQIYLTGAESFGTAEPTREASPVCPSPRIDPPQ